MTETLPLTGERTAPGIWHENYWFARHEAAYRWITANWIGTDPGRILDAGCGEGYGADLLLRAGAVRVVGLDYEPTSLQHLAKAYPQINLVQGNLVQTGFADDSFDLAVSLQTIEHLWEQPRFIAECARILKPDSVLVLSTPNRLTFPSGNWYHTKELTADEFIELVEPRPKNPEARSVEIGERPTTPGLEMVEALGLWHGQRLAGWEAKYGSCVDAQLARAHAEWNEDLVELVKSVTYQDFEIRPGDLDDSLDLIVVARRRTS